MRRTTLFLPLIIAALYVGPIDQVAAEDSTNPTSPDLWERTRETAGDWWQRSRDYAGRAMEDARRLFSDDPAFGQIWQEALPKLEETLVLEEHQAELPETAWIGTDQRANRAAIDELLDQTVEILSTSPVQRYRTDIRTLQGEIEKARAGIADYRQKRVAAPAESALQTTVAGYDRLIETREAEIARLTERLDGIKREFAGELRGMGLDVSDEQVEFLLSTVVGDNLVDLGILFDNVKAMTLQLEQLVAQSGEDLQSARRYYGLYVVLLQALSRMHLQIEESIGEQYVPQIDSIISRAQSLSAETQRLQRESPSKQEVLASNLAAQQLTIETAGVYRQYLEDQSKQVQKARQEIDRDIATAWNTYETVRVSGELVSLVKSSQQLLEGLMNRQVPALRPFENLEMQREFEKLTQQLRGPVER